MKSIKNATQWFFIFFLVVIGAIGIGMYESAKWLAKGVFGCMDVGGQ